MRLLRSRVSARMHTALLAIFCTALTALSIIASPTTAQAAETGRRTTFAIGARYPPIGLSVFNELGYRFKLSDSDSLLLKGTYIEGGLWTLASPAYVRSGAYIDALPLSILNIRVAAQYTNYFGTFGFLYIPENQDAPSWEIDDFNASADQGEGVRGNALNVETVVTLRARAGDLVVLVPIQHVFISNDIDAEVYYEPYYDLLYAKTDQSWTIRPTLGYVVYNDEAISSYVLAGARYERTITLNSDVTTDWAGGLAVWGMPDKWFGKGRATLTLLAGYWINHPTTRQNIPFGAFKFGVAFGAR